MLIVPFHIDRAQHDWHTTTDGITFRRPIPVRQNLDFDAAIWSESHAISLQVPAAAVTISLGATTRLTGNVATIVDAIKASERQPTR